MMFVNLLKVHLKNVNALMLISKLVDFMRRVKSVHYISIVHESVKFFKPKLYYVPFNLPVVLFKWVLMGFKYQGGLKRCKMF